MQRTLQTNIYGLYLIKLSKWFMLIMPIVALYYTENGLDAYDIYLLQAIYSVSVAVLEIPSGYMADIIGRKKSLVMGSILGTLGFVLYSLSHDFTGFLLAEITLGLGGSFISGSDSALLYDSLASMKKEHRYLRLEGRITSLGNFAETTAALCGGLLAAAISYRFVYASQAVIAAIAIPASLMLIEPPREKITSTPGIRHILRVCRESLFVNLELSSTLLLSAIIGTSTLCMAWTAQVYFVYMGLTEELITPLWVALNLTVAVVAAFASRVVEKMGKRQAILSIVLFIPASYIALGMVQLIPAVIVLLIFYAIRGYATPLLKDLTNSHCRSETRATVLSIRNMIIRFGFALLGPFIGSLSAGYSLSFALKSSGVVLLILSGAAAWFVFHMLGDDFKES
ncbi:MFS transporter [Desulfopila inferna]|uniref:MFS transporter n=1 Tax=Desulfopila inferna TaxID=468528 RepID=UPI0019650FC5|nr:MFS transporter [Desulfopila inferna]MBM9603977.1 MFS transporter [Desulfopila inferna]